MVAVAADAKRPADVPTTAVEPMAAVAVTTVAVAAAMVAVAVDAKRAVDVLRRARAAARKSVAAS